MKSLKYLIPTVLLFLVIGLVVFVRPAFDTAYQDTKMFLAGITGGSFDYNKYNELVRENESLRFKINNLEKETVSELEEGKIFKVFSRYPFNNKELLIINAGRDDGITMNLPVLTKDGFLVGKIVSVNGRQSEVQTVFDPSWKTSVGINSASNKAVMKGGQPPKLELIPKECQVKEGDFVFNISPDFPYKALIGEVKNIKEVNDQIWNSGVMNIPYNLDQITEVKVFVNFP